MFFDFNFRDIKTFTLEIKQGNSIQRQMFQGNVDMAQIQFEQLFQEVVNTSQPIRIKISSQEEIESKIDKTSKQVETFVQFANKSYMDAFPNEFKQSQNERQSVYRHFYLKEDKLYTYQDWMENTPIFGEIKDVYAQIWNKDKEEEF